MLTARHLLTALAVCSVVLAACGGDAGGGDVGSSDGAASEATDGQDDGRPDTTEQAVAALSLFDAAAELAFADAADTYTPAADGDDVAVGDTIRTDQTGFAQLDFTDGSLARLDTDTTLTVVALGEVDTPTVELDLDVGRVWNSVRDLGDTGTYEITTDVGTAAVRGTVFIVWVREDGSTLVAVYDGEVTFATTDGEDYVLGPGDSLELGADGSTDGPGPVPDTLASDPFVIRNQQFDATGEDPGRRPDDVTALAGDYDVTMTLEELTFGARDDFEAPLESVAPFFPDVPLEVDTSREDRWTIGEDGRIAIPARPDYPDDAWPSVTTLAATGPGTFGGGLDRVDLGVDACTPFVVSDLLELAVTTDGGSVSGFVGTWELLDHREDAENCRPPRFRLRLSVNGTRIGPPELDVLGSATP